MKAIIIFFILVSINIFSYEFSKDLPKNTLFYLTIKDFNALTQKLSKTPSGKFQKSEKFKAIENNFKKMVSFVLYGEEQDMTKTNSFYKNFKNLVFNPFAFSIGLSKFFKPQYALLIKGKNLDKTFELLYKDLLKKDFKEANVKIKKELYKNIKINILEIKIKLKAKKNIYRNYKKNIKKENKTIVYATINDKLIITNSQEYMNLIISTIKNTNSPKLSNNLIFKKDYQKYKKSDLYMFLDVKTVLKLASTNKDLKKIIEHYSLNKLESLISYLKFENDDYSIFTKLIAKNTLPSIIKDVLFKNTTIEVPQFIPETCYNFNAINIDFTKFLELANKFQTEKERRKLQRFEGQLGISFKELVNSIGKTLYYLSFYKDNKEEGVFLFTFNKPKFLLKVITTIGSNPMVGMIEKDYLDGKIITASGSFSMIGYALGSKNNNFIFGSTNMVKEIMQKMSGNSGSFYNTKFYKALISNMSKEQSAIVFTKSSTFTFLVIKGILKSFKKEYNMGSDKKEMKLLKAIKRVFKSFAQYTIKDLDKYFSYSLTKIYTDKNELVLKIK